MQEEKNKNKNKKLKLREHLSGRNWDGQIREERGLL